MNEDLQGFKYEKEMCLCLGPFKSGKTLLMKSLQGDEIDNATYTVSTNGINLFTIKNDTGEFDMVIKEIGGSMAPIWKHYFDKVLVSQNTVTHNTILK